jgi:phosphonate metabolism protein (transferase hexapeptide repeat family)
MKAMPRLSATEPLIHPGCAITDSRFGAWCEVGRDSRIQYSTFGDFANIAAMTRIGPTDHPMDRASLHHFLYRSAAYWPDAEDDPDFFARRRARRTVIGPDTWLGHGVIVKPDVTIGAGAVVAAGAVVTRDVAPYMIVAGIPASPLRQRFAEPVAGRMMALAWWDWSHERLRQALPDFRSLQAEAFLEKYGG